MSVLGLGATIVFTIPAISYLVVRFFDNWLQHPQNEFATTSFLSKLMLLGPEMKQKEVYRHLSRGYTGGVGYAFFH